MKDIAQEATEDVLSTQALLRFVQEFFDAIESGEIDQRVSDLNTIAAGLQQTQAATTPTTTSTSSPPSPPTKQDDPHHDHD